MTTATDPYTPTTQEVRRGYVRAMRQAFIDSESGHAAEFDRWIETVRHEAWEEGFKTSEESSPFRDNPYRQSNLGPQEGPSNG